MLRGRLKRSAVPALMLTLVSGVALAASVKIKVKAIDVFLPGVNGGGNMSFNQGGDGLAKITFNSKTGTARVIARGDVHNLSGKAQKYKDVGVLPNIGDVVKDDYKVSKRGNAVYTGVSKNIDLGI